MSDNTKIEWSDATWNPMTGCDEVSPGCDHCYAKTFAERWRGIPGHYFENGFDVQLRPDKLDQPLRWRKPRKIFVNSMSDLFHKDVPDEYIARVFAVMAATPHHTYQVLTKRHGRMRSLLSNGEFRKAVQHRVSYVGDDDYSARHYRVWPLPNVWLGVSVEDQKRADLRIPALLDTPAAVRFLSCEPLLGPVDLGFGDPHRNHESDDVNGYPHPRICLTCSTEEHEVEYFRREPGGHGVDWVIVGGESGRGARPMHPQWARSLRDQCAQAGVPFHFKQWGEWAPVGLGIGKFDPPERLIGDALDDMGHRQIVRRVGKHQAGRLLDNRTWDEFPAAA